MILYTKSPECRSRKHCGYCRDLKGQREWREGLRVGFRLPNDKTDFDCPAKPPKPWGYIPPEGEKPKPVPLTPEQKKRAEEAKRRYGICQYCDDTKNTGDGCKHRKGCCFGSFRSRPESKCPHPAGDKWTVAVADESSLDSPEPEGKI